MDWSKAKNILIVALLITNLVLLGAIYHTRDHSDAKDVEHMKEDTVLLLREHDIYVREDLIPDRIQRMPVLSVRYRTVETDAIAQAIEKSGVSLLPHASEKEYNKAADELLSAAGVSCEHFMHRDVQRQGDSVEVVYGVQYQGYSLDNARFSVIFQGGRPVSMGNSWVEVISMGKNKKWIMTASTALVKFMTSLRNEEFSFKESIIVDEIRLVYWLEGYTDNIGVSEDTAVPYWCIRYNEDQWGYIPAYEQ